MPENCEAVGGQGCPHGEQIARMDARIAMLEKDKEKEQEFRVTYYRDREERSRHEAKMDERLDQMSGDLSSIRVWMEQQKNRPNKLLDDLGEKAVWAVLAAVIAYMLAHLGL